MALQNQQVLIPRGCQEQGGTDSGEMVSGLQLIWDTRPGIDFGAMLLPSWSKVADFEAIARAVLRLEGQGADFGQMEVDDYEARADLWLILK